MTSCLAAPQRWTLVQQLQQLAAAGSRRRQLQTAHLPARSAALLLLVLLPPPPPQQPAPLTSPPVPAVAPAPRAIIPPLASGCSSYLQAHALTPRHSLLRRPHAPPSAPPALVLELPCRPADDAAPAAPSSDAAAAAADDDSSEEALRRSSATRPAAVSAGSAGGSSAATCAAGEATKATKLVRAPTMPATDRMCPGRRRAQKSSQKQRPLPARLHDHLPGARPRVQPVHRVRHRVQGERPRRVQRHL